MSPGSSGSERKSFGQSPTPRYGTSRGEVQSPQDLRTQNAQQPHAPDPLRRRAMRSVGLMEGRMTIRSGLTGFSEEQRELWDRAAKLWSLSQTRDQKEIESALHPDYVGWDMNAPTPHDRMA